MTDDWRKNLVGDDAGIREILKETRRIAVLGIKTDAHADQPAFYVARTLKELGYEVLPVPVYYPEITRILGQEVYRTVAAVPPPVDLVDVFRRPQDVPGHVDDILAARPKCVWMQLGIRNDEAAERFAKAGIRVVQDRCLMVEARKLGARVG